MDTITTQAVYHKGVLKPRKKLNIPENSIVEVQIKKVGRQGQYDFATLIGIWKNLSEAEIASLEIGLKDVRRKSERKVTKLLK